MTPWDTPNDVNGATMQIALQYQNRWSLGKFRVILDNHGLINTGEYIANRDFIFDELIIAVLRNARFSRGDKSNYGFQGSTHDFLPEDAATNDIASILTAPSKAREPPNQVRLTRFIQTTPSNTARFKAVP